MPRSRLQQQDDQNASALLLALQLPQTAPSSSERAPSALREGVLVLCAIPVCNNLDWSAATIPIA